MMQFSKLTRIPSLANFGFRSIRLCQYFRKMPLFTASRTVKWAIAMILVMVVFLLTDLRYHLFPRKFAMVTLFSEDHVCEAIHSCLSLTKMPEIVSNKIEVFAFYAPDVSNKSLNAYSKACPVAQQRLMNFTGLPEFTKNLRNYRFKFPMVNKILPLFDAVLYFDASIIFRSSKTNDSLTNIFNSVFTDFKHTGFRAFEKLFHSNFAVTHKDMYKFFNVTLDEMKKLQQFASGHYVVANSPQGRNVFSGILRCAIEPECMAPPGAQPFCNGTALHANEGPTCHRFDQSAMNMRLIELYGTDQTNYWHPTDVTSVQRTPGRFSYREYQRICKKFYERDYGERKRYTLKRFAQI